MSQNRIVASLYSLLQIMYVTVTNNIIIKWMRGRGAKKRDILKSFISSDSIFNI